MTKEEKERVDKLYEEKWFPDVLAIKAEYKTWEEVDLAFDTGDISTHGVGIGPTCIINEKDEIIFQVD